MILTDGTSRKGIWRYKKGSRYEKGDLVIYIDSEDNVTLASINVSQGEILVASDWSQDLANGKISTYYDSTVASLSDVNRIIDSQLSWFLLNSSNESIAEELELPLPITDVNSLIIPGLYRVTELIDGLPDYRDNPNWGQVYRLYLKGFVNTPDNLNSIHDLLSNPIYFNKTEEATELIIESLINNPGEKVRVMDFSSESSFNGSRIKSALNTLTQSISYEGETLRAVYDQNTPFIGYIRVSKYTDSDSDTEYLFYEFLDFVSGKYFITDNLSHNRISSDAWIEMTGSISQEYALKDYVESAKSAKTSWEGIVQNYNDRIKYENWIPNPSDEESGYIPFESDDVCYLFNLKVKIKSNNIIFWRKYSIKIDKFDATPQDREFVYDEYGSKVVCDSQDNLLYFYPGTYQNPEDPTQNLTVEITSRYKGYN